MAVLDCAAQKKKATTDHTDNTDMSTCVPIGVIRVIRGWFFWRAAESCTVI